MASPYPTLIVRPGRELDFPVLSRFQCVDLQINPLVKWYCRPLSFSGRVSMFKETLVVVVEVDEKIAGCTAASIMDVRINGKHVRISHGFDGRIEEKYRNLGLLKVCTKYWQHWIAQKGADSYIDFASPKSARRKGNSGARNERIDVAPAAWMKSKAKSNPKVKTLVGDEADALFDKQFSQYPMYPVNIKDITGLPHFRAYYTLEDDKGYKVGAAIFQSTIMYEIVKVGSEPKVGRNQPFNNPDGYYLLFGSFIAPPASVDSKDPAVKKHGEALFSQLLEHLFHLTLNSTPVVSVCDRGERIRKTGLASPGYLLSRTNRQWEHSTLFDAFPVHFDDNVPSYTHDAQIDPSQEYFLDPRTLGNLVYSTDQPSANL
eukprot:TRINITY_DN12701_c0_g1_i1.p1 TRINITY_DN12701_c0_g1~~TRINITY_DN12701_c0_g1_i1.p1  ORF type:complete len:374 (-),score=69.21 TRINITY_DN12701_c0_g1_i1:28-1149(-)